MNYAYITLLSSMNYIPPVIILNKNLQELKSQFSLYVMVTENIYDKAIKYLNQEQILSIKVPVIQYSEMAKQYWGNHTVLNTASKLNIFNLTQFDKVVYLDADSLFLKNIDYLFNYPDKAMYDDRGDFGFSGLFVCTPSNHNLKRYLNLINHTSMVDGDLLGQEWSEFKTNIKYRISFNHFINITWEDLDKAPQQYGSIIGIHFCYSYKPWNYISLNNYLNDYKSELNHYSKLREMIVEFYINTYVLPLRKKYPEIFKR